MINGPADRELALQGVYPAFISQVRVNGDLPPQAMQFAPVEQVVYSVVVDAGDTQLTFDGVIPWHRRPVPMGSGIEIEFARPGDECEARVRGDGQYRFVIQEGLAPGVCA